MSSRLLVIIVVVTTLSDILLARPLEPIVWSVQNKIFDVSSDSSNEETTITNHNGHTIEVRLGDFLNILCPKYSGGQSAARSTSNNNNDPLGLVNTAEYHAIYRVSRQEFDECRIRDIEKKQPVLKCDRPSENVKYTLYISKFSPVPDAIEFLPGHSYYFISTSNGMFSGLGNNQDGTCRSNNMKIIIKVEDAANKKVSTTTAKSRITTVIASHQSSSSSSSTPNLRPELNPPVATPGLSVDTSHPTMHNFKPASSGKANINSYAILDGSSASSVSSSHSNNRNGHNIRNYVHTRGSSQNILSSSSSSTYKPFRFTIDFTPSTKKSTTTISHVVTTPTAKKTVATNDDIFILEPDSIDYNDLIAQLIQQQKQQKTNSDIESYGDKTDTASAAAATSKERISSSSENEYAEEAADAAFINAAASSSSPSTFISHSTIYSSLFFYLVLLLIIIQILAV